MILRDVATHLEVRSTKLTDYALNMRHPIGRHKARVFASALGYTVDNYIRLITQIEAYALDAPAYLTRSDKYGEHFQVDLMIEGVEGQQAMVRTGWLIQSGGRVATLTTLFVIG